jgi:hypothetical protein
MDGSRGVHRAKGGSFTHLFTWRVWRRALRGEWKRWVRKAWAPPFMGGARRLRASLFCGEFLLGGGRTLGGGRKLGRH